MKTYKQFITEAKGSFDIGSVYHQEFDNKDKLFFKPTEQLKNGRYKGLMVDHPLLTNKAGKPKNKTADPSIPFWKKTPDNEIPDSLK